MRVLLDCLPLSGPGSLAIVTQRLLEGWGRLGTDDDLHVIVGPQDAVEFPDFVTVHQVEKRRVRAQNVELPRLARAIGADAVLGTLPTTTVSPLPCPRVIMAYDIRHELRPHQFSRRNRAQRKVSYGLGWRMADAICCISDRTRQDLLRSRPWLAKKPVRVTWLGGDHVDGWPRDPDAPPYAIAFGQYGNKNVDLVVDAWEQLPADTDLPLTLVGLGAEPRARLQDRLDRSGLADRVTLSPWLSDDAFRSTFASASLIVFPSDFEGFGLPAVEGLRLGIRSVITPDPALLEVTGGHASVMAGWGAADLAEAVVATPREGGLDAEARAWADQFTWANTARGVRAAIAEVLP